MTAWLEEDVLGCLVDVRCVRLPAVPSTAGWSGLVPPTAGPLDAGCTVVPVRAMPPRAESELVVNL